MTKETILNIVEVTRRAVAWLQKNPDRHHKGDFALTKNGNRTLPTRTTAYCFCFLGRVAKEAGLDPDATFFLKDEKPTRAELIKFADELEQYQMEKLSRFYAPLDIETTWLWTMNDAGPGDKEQRLFHILRNVERQAMLKLGEPV
jgi:hypothetical protein